MAPDRGEGNPKGLRLKLDSSLPTPSADTKPAKDEVQAEDVAKENTSSGTQFSLEPFPSQSSDEEDPNQAGGSDENSHLKPQDARLYNQRGSTSHPQLPPTAGLYPPFYNRPPTSLPQSPSLTSLLRPPFSTQTSRPTTPDSSDVEVLTGNGTSTPASTAAAVAKSARTATTVPRAAPKVPTYEYYGFALYMVSSAAFLMYLLWAFLPSPFLHELGIYYYPNRWWALAVPAWLVVLLGYVYVALASYNTQRLTLPMKSIENLVDEAAQVAVVDEEGKIVQDRRMGGTASRGSGQKKSERGVGKHGARSRGHYAGSKKAMGAAIAEKDVDWKRYWSEGTDAVMDVPIGAVCEILYGSSPEAED